MAKHISFSSAVNESEAWAFNFLERHLPDDFLLLTNLDIYEQNRSHFEIDAIVVGEYAVYFIDVKGYTGVVEAGPHVWRIGSRDVESPLPKLNRNCKVFASRLRTKLGSISTPWVQGAVFVTGAEGTDVVLRKPEQNVAAYTASEIIKALTRDSYLTSKHRSPLTEAQKAGVKEAIGQFALVEARSHKVGDFHKTDRLADFGGWSVWLGQFSHQDIDIPFLLKILERSAIPHAADRKELEESFRSEFRLYQELAGMAGVPYVAPLIDQGDFMVLPIRRPHGLPVSAIEFSRHEMDNRLRAIRSAARAVAGFHARGVCHGAISGNQIYVSDDMACEFIDFKANQDDCKPEDDVRALAETFSPWFSDAKDEPALSVNAWIEDTRKNDGGLLALEEIDRLLTGGVTISGNPNPYTEFTVQPGAIINEAYELEEKISDTGLFSTWRSHHLLGKFDCVVRVYDMAEEYFDDAIHEFEILSRLYHPGLVRTFDMGRVGQSDQFFMSMAVEDGENWKDFASNPETTGNEILGSLREVLQALKYLHRRGLTHRHICPDNIIVTERQAVLVGMSGMPSNHRSSGDVRYKDPSVLINGWTAYSDLYSLARSIVDDLEELSAKSRTKVGPGLEKLTKVLASCRALMGDATTLITEQTDYLDLFGLDETDKTISEIPERIRQKYAISSGYMTFLTLDMLNDQRPRSRNQWVLGALRSRKIPGNKTNRGSMSSTVSRLKSNGIAEEHGKKLRLTRSFLDDFEVSRKAR